MSGPWKGIGPSLRKIPCKNIVLSPSLQKIRIACLSDLYFFPCLSAHPVFDPEQNAKKKRRQEGCCCHESSSLSPAFRSILCAHIVFCHSALSKQMRRPFKTAHSFMAFCRLDFKSALLRGADGFNPNNFPHRCCYTACVPGG